MVRINGESFWLCLPTFTDVLIRSESFQRLESPRDVIGHEEGMQLLFQMVMGLVVVLLHGGFFARAVHAFHLAIGPGMVGFGEAVLDTIVLADAIDNMVEG